MPTYQYSCTDCGEQVEVVQKFSDDSLTVCPHCGGKLRKVFSPVGIVFKGSGFYRTDSRNGSSAGDRSKKDKEPSGSGSDPGLGRGVRGEVVRGRQVWGLLGLVVFIVLVGGEERQQELVGEHGARCFLLGLQVLVVWLLRASPGSRPAAEPVRRPSRASRGKGPPAPGGWLTYARERAAGPGSASRDRRHRRVGFL